MRMYEECLLLHLVFMPKETAIYASATNFAASKWSEGAFVVLAELDARTMGAC